MKKSLITIFLLLSSCLIILGCAQQQNAKNEIEVLLKGNKGLESFRTLGASNWRAENGVILADAGGEGFLITKKSYGDFQLRIEFWADHTTNSGIFIRMSDPELVNSANSYEVNIFDQRPDPLYGTGAIVDVVKVDPMPKSGGQWNTYEITAQGSHLRVRLNGIETANVEDDKHQSGPIAFQFGNVPSGKPGAIKWRLIEIQPL